MRRSHISACCPGDAAVSDGTTPTSSKERLVAVDKKPGFVRAGELDRT